MERNLKLKSAKKSAQAAHLIYVHDDIPGISRVKVGDDFEYFNEEGQKITNEAELSRIKSLGVPPAYTNVWICPIPDGHLQATARDVKGRKQYRYHPDWRKYRTQINHWRMIEFGKQLPSIRKTVDDDLNSQGLDKTKVLATVVKLLDLSLIRVGNEEYAKENHSYGLTTMRDKHVKIKSDKILFEFKGKSNQRHKIEIKNKKLARIVQRCMEVPGYDLFQYYDKHRIKHSLSSTDVNEYIKKISGSEFTAKDFRTWWGTVFAMLALQNCPVCETKRELKSNVVSAVKDVSKKLGNTPAVCRKNYIYPGLIDSYLEGELPEAIEIIESHFNKFELSAEELCTLRFLEKQTKTKRTRS